MEHVVLGCGPFPPSRAGYIEEFDCVELVETWFEPIRRKTLRAWKRDLGESTFEFIPVAWQWLTVDPLDIRGDLPFDHPKADFGFLQDTEANAQAWAATLEQLEAADAQRFVLKTPASFSPSQKNRDAMAAFFERHVRPSGRIALWEPRGIWTVDEARELADELGAVLALDPYTDPEFPEPPEGEAYYIFTGPSGRRDFSADDMLDVAEWLADHEHRVTCLFRGQDRVWNARALRRAIARSA